MAPDSAAQPEASRPQAVPAAPFAAAPVDAAPVAAAQAIRFCRVCGSAWEAAWLECAHCALASPPASAAVEAERRFKDDQREIRSAVRLYFTLLSVSAVLMIALLAAGRDATAGEQLVAGTAMALITTVWCLLVARRDVIPRLLEPVSIVWFPIATVAAAPTYAIAAAAVMALHAAFDLPELRYLDSFVEGGWSFGWAVTGICVMPAIFEEMSFRGVIFGALQRVLSTSEALLVSALMFAILHLSVPSMPHLFLMGLLLGWLRQRTGSLLPGMLTHFTHNLLVLLGERNEGFLPW